MCGIWSCFELGKEKRFTELNDDTYMIADVSNRINELSKLLQITEQDFANARKIDTLMGKHAMEIAERHYEMLMKIPETKAIFEENTYYERYTAVIGEYFKGLTKPKFSKDYVEYRKKIGRRVVQTEHALYQWWSYNALLGYHSIEDLQDAKREECRFGKWYQEMKQSFYCQMPAFQAIEEPHQEFHQLVEEVKETIEQGSKPDANKLLHQLNEKTNEIIRLLKELQKEVI